MSNSLIVNVDASDELLLIYGAGAVLRLERSALPTSGFTEISTTPLVAGVTQYEIVDPTGTTSSYYQTRYSNASGSGSPSPYSDVFQIGALTAYATLANLRETMNLPDNSKDNQLSDLLVMASARIDSLCGRDFYRHPQISGTETRTYHVGRRASNRLSSAIGRGVDIISISSLTLADVTGNTPTSVPAGASGYFLEPDNPMPGWPYEDVILSNLGGSFLSYPLGYNIVAITGAFGWSAVPPLVELATLDQARTWYHQAAGGGAPVGISAFGTPVFGPDTPATVMQVWEAYRRQSFAFI